MSFKEFWEIVLAILVSRVIYDIILVELLKLTLKKVKGNEKKDQSQSTDNVPS